MIPRIIHTKDAVVRADLFAVSLLPQHTNGVSAGEGFTWAPDS